MSEDFAKDHLNLVLSFFPRVDSSIALLVGLEVAMIGYLAVKVPDPRALQSLGWFVILTLVGTVSTLTASFVMLFRAAFPQVESAASLIYFREIGKRTNAQFSEAYKAADKAALLEDLIGQIWRNSEILALKYDRLKAAYGLLATAIPVWLAALMLL